MTEDDPLDPPKSHEEVADHYRMRMDDTLTRAFIAALYWRARAEYWRAKCREAQP